VKLHLMPAAMRIMHDRSIASFPKRSYNTCFARFLLYAVNSSEIKFSLDLRRSVNFGSRDSCVEDAVYHHRFETRAQLRYCIKVVSQPVNPLPFLRHRIVLNIKRTLYHRVNNVSHVNFTALSAQTFFADFK